MGRITVIAAEGVRAKVTVQKPQVLTRETPAVTHEGLMVAPAKTESFTVFAAQSVVSFASESREFEIDADTRLLVEEQPAS